MEIKTEQSTYFASINGKLYSNEKEYERDFRELVGAKRGKISTTIKRRLKKQ